MPFTFQPTALPEVLLVSARAFGDERGFFQETWAAAPFAAAGIPDRFVQDNHAHSTAGVLRGLHYQNPPRAQGKLVGCLAGEIFDVAVDIRRGSPTYGRHVSATLSADNHQLLWVPPGFAHGYVVLSALAEVSYKVSGEYSPAHEGGVAWDDPALAIPWPIRDPLLSAKDRALPPLERAVNGFVYPA